MRKLFKFLLFLAGCGVCVFFGWLGFSINQWVIGG